MERLRRDKREKKSKYDVKWCWYRSITITRWGKRWFTHPVRRRLEGPGRGPRSTRAVSAASPSSRFTRHYTMSQGWQLLSLDSRLRLKLAREELALSLPPNPEDAPLLLTPQSRNHASHHFLVFSRLIRGIPSVIFLVLVQGQVAGCERFLPR